jgi:ubiquinone/menaquinone biosynthesis C-methylase UbiE
MTTPHIDRIREQFTRTADAYIRLRQTTDEKSLRALVEMAGANSTHRVLDVACGPGFLTMAFAAVAARADGLDATDAFLDHARAEAGGRGLNNVEFRSGDAQRLPFDDAAFDIVSCRAAFHHFEHPERVLAEMKRVAKPGGRLLVADMLSSEDPAKAAYHNATERLVDPTHVRALPVSEFRKMFEVAGVETIMSPTMSMHWDVAEWMAHGEPSPDVQPQILARMEASIENDLSGLNVRREDGKLRFTYGVAVFLLRVP